jgi:hypothetical protein
MQVLQEFRVMPAFTFQRRAQSLLSLAALLFMSGAVLAQPNSTTSAAKTPDAKIEWLYGQVPALSINGELSPLMHYGVCNNSAGVREDLVPHCRDVGLHLYTLYYCGFNWLGEGHYDFPGIDDDLGRVVKADPQAHVILQLGVDNCAPGLAPWADKHPEEMVRDETGSTKFRLFYGPPSGRVPSMASKVWLNDTADMLRGLIRHVCSGPYADRVIGYIPMSGLTGEWIYWGSTEGDFVDYSRPFQVAFQDWAKRKYGGDLKMLNERWHKEFASFDEIRIPTKSERMRTDYGDLLDP